MEVGPEDVLRFWFGDGQTPRFELWFGADQATDQALRHRFSDALERASRGALDAWEALGPRGRLGLVVLLDQFTRNLHRGSARMFENDARALALTHRGLAAGDDRALTVLQAGFLYLPLEHSEALADQEASVAAFTALHGRAPPELRDATAGMLRYARLHEVPIRRFGRFPHRNALLGRETTPEEAAFLQGPDASF